MHTRTAIALAALASTLILPSTAAADEGGFRFHQRLRPHVSTTEADFGPRTSGDGFGLDWEMLFHSRIGLGVGAFTTDLDEWFDDDEARMTAVTAAALFHMTPDRAVDFYLGPGLAWVAFSDETPGLDLDDSIDPMIQLGFDVVPKGSRVGFNFDVKNIFGSQDGTLEDDDHWHWDWDDHDHHGHGEDGFSVTISAGVVVRF